MATNPELHLHARSLPTAIASQLACHPGIGAKNVIIQGSCLTDVGPGREQIVVARDGCVDISAVAVAGLPLGEPQ